MTRSLLAAALLLAGCATADETGYPSLGPRAAEGLGFEEPAVAAPAPATADPALDARLATDTATLAGIVRTFDAAATRAQAATSKAGAKRVGSDPWLDAQAALAALDDPRAQATALASALDDAAATRAGEVGTPYPALDALRARAATEAEREAAAIARIAALLPLP